MAGLEEVVGKKSLCQRCAWAGLSSVLFPIRVNGRLGMVSTWRRSWEGRGEPFVERSRSAWSWALVVAIT